MTMMLWKDYTLRIPTRMAMARYAGTEPALVPETNIEVGGDCDDNDASIHPDAEITADGVDRTRWY